MGQVHCHYMVKGLCMVDWDSRMVALKLGTMWTTKVDSISLWKILKGEHLTLATWWRGHMTKCLRELKRDGWASSCFLDIVEVLHGKEREQLLLGHWQRITDSRAIIKKGILTMSSMSVGLDLHPKTDKRSLWFCL